MIGKRTGIDFSKHEVIVQKNDLVSIYYLKKPNTVIDSIKYINCEGIMSVTGDYGNWIFCREFHPHEMGGVSDGYWVEKLKILSSQEPLEFDKESTEKELLQRLENYKNENSETIDEYDEVVEYFEECLSQCTEHELDYTYCAYRNIPKEYEYDFVTLIKDEKYWLKAVFDGFDEICRRLKDKELIIED
jgi:hypothetical protein